MSGGIPDAVSVSDYIFGNGWVPGSSRRVVVKEADHTWNISRNNYTASVSSALGVVLVISLLSTLLRM